MTIRTATRRDAPADQHRPVCVHRPPGHHREPRSDAHALRSAGTDRVAAHPRQNPLCPKRSRPRRFRALKETQ